MRRATMDVDIVWNDAKKPIGVIIGHDFCCEHECGIRPLLDMFGVTFNPKAIGVKARKITRVPPGLQWIRKGIRAGILQPTPFSVAYEGDKCEENAWKNHHDYGPGGLYSSWDEKSFMLTSDKANEIAALREIFDAFQGCDIVITTLAGGFGTNPFLGIASALIPDIIKTWEDHDLHHIKVQVAFKKTGIEKVLTKAKRGYFSLVPKQDRGGPLMFWLNPFEQEIYNSGYFTLQDLKDWAKGRGKVIKAKAQTAA